MPIGEEASSFKGVIALTEPSAYLLKKMDRDLSREQMVKLLLQEYDVDEVTAHNDVDSFITKLVQLGLIE